MSLTLESRHGAGAWPGDPLRGPLIGRDVELSLLRGLVDPSPAASRVLVVIGDAGIGKSALLADMTQRARSAAASAGGHGPGAGDEPALRSPSSASAASRGRHG